MLMMRFLTLLLESDGITLLGFNTKKKHGGTEEGLREAIDCVIKVGEKEVIS